MSDDDKAPVRERPDVVTKALERFRLSASAYTDQRQREKDALAFQVPKKQWPEDIQRTRDAAVVGTMELPARPMLSIPTLDQPIQLVLNQERQAHLGVQVHAMDEDADDETAEVLQGLYRRIEVDSRANLARSWAHERAVKAGIGWYRVLTELDPSSPEKSDHRIVIKRILRQESVYPDPFAQEPDWSDGEFLIIAQWMPYARFVRKYGQAKGDKASQLAGLDTGEFAALAEECPLWVLDNGEGKSVLIAEYFDVEVQDDGTRQITWRLITALDVLDEQHWLGQYIPVIPCIGRELIPFDAERRWVGIIEPNMDAARAVNYAASGAVETVSLEPKAPFDVDPEEIKGYEPFYGQANVRNFPYLPRHKVVRGQLMPPLNRVQADTTKLQMSMMLLQEAKDFVHIGTFAYEPTLGQDSGRQVSGKKVLALQQQHDQGSSNWLDNLAEISMTYEAKVVLDLIPHYYDRKGRIARILDQEDTPKTVMLNQPFVMGGPKKNRPMPMPMPGPQGPPPGAPPGPMPGMMPGKPPASDIKHYDLTKGRYGVSVSIGKAYKSRIEQGADELGQLFQAEPQLFSILGDLYLKFRDFPGHAEAAERVKKMLPPPLQGGDAQGPSPQQLQQQLQQAQQMLGALTKELNAKNQYIDTEQGKIEAQQQLEAGKLAAGLKEKELDAALQIRLQEMKNAAEIRKAEIAAAIKGYQTEAQHAAQHEEQALNIQAEFVQADLARENAAHEAQLDRETALAQASMTQPAGEHGQGT